jgi:hypothetical protein
MPVIEDVLWKNPGIPGMIVVPSHAAVGPDQRLFLGYGEGKEAVRRIQDIELECAQAIQEIAVGGVYGFLPIRPSLPARRVVGFGLFQERYDWNEPASLELIATSMEKLREFAYANINTRIRMSYPGIEDGLDSSKLAGVLLPLPPTVTLCHRGDLTRTIPDHFPGFKNIYLSVEAMVQEGRFNLAVEHLVQNGFDLQSAYEQASAVQRLLQAR